MANYCCAIRTNYFRVKDEDKFRALMNRVYGLEDSVELWEEKHGEQTIFGFGCYGGIAGVRNAMSDEDDDIDEDTAYDEFVKGLQECVADDDAIIIMEAGNEKLRYVIGAATVITSNGYEYLDIERIATAKGAEMLNHPEWKTQCDY